MSDTLPVGDELRRLIRVHIFGECPHLHTHIRTLNYVGEYDTHVDTYTDTICDDCGEDVGADKDYLTGNGMLLIVEKMKEEGWEWTANAHGNVTSWLFYRPEIGIADSGKSATHEHAPTTTAYAALRALKVIK